MNIYIYFFFVITHFLIQYLDIHGPLGRGEGGYEYIYIFFFCDNLLSYPVPGHSWPIGEGGGGYTPIAPLALQACKGIFCCFENISKGSVCIVSPFEPFCE